MDFPQLQPFVQHFTQSESIGDPVLHLRERISLSGLFEKIRPEQRVALAVGSRGITNLVAMVRTLVEAVAERDAHSFIIPSMGSHGGATAQGQKEILHALGVSEKSCGAPIVSSMEVVDLGQGTQEGARLLVSADALNADWVIPLARIKAHTAFQGSVESGLLKMLVVGLGKEQGARSFHLYSLRSPFPGYMIELANGLMAHLKIAAGVAVLEDVNARTIRLELVGLDDFERTDSELLALCKKLSPRLPFQEADVLVVERMGKDISGAGLDTTVIGRSRHPVRPEPESPRIRRIWVRSLTPDSHGNAKGIGLADFVSAPLIEEMDPGVTITNALTALVPEHAFVPPALEPERKILTEAFRSSGDVVPKEAKLVWIKDTSSLGRLLVSPALGVTLTAPAKPHPEGRAIPFLFDDAGNLVSFEQHWLKATGGPDTG